MMFKEKRTKLAAIIIAGSMLFAGCGSSTGKAVTDSESTTSAAAEEQVTEAAQEVTTEQEALKTKYPLTISIYDAEGNQVETTFDKAPEKVVSTQLSMTELLLELGLEDKIAAIFDNDNALTGKWAETIEGLNSLGDKKSVSKESIVAMSPDLILGKGPLMFTETSIGTVQSYQELGINVYTQFASASMEQSLENILEDIRNIGMIFDVQDAANAYADELQAKLDTIMEKAEKNKSEDALNVIFMAGYSDGTFQAFSSNLHSAMLETINAKNVLEKGASGLTLENLIELNPDAIIYVKADRFAQTDETAIDSLLSNEVIASVNAIAEGKVIAVNYDDVMDYGARIFDSIDDLYKALYGE